MSPANASYGSWKSPITSTLLTSAGIGFSELQFSNGELYWLESRPDEAGRVAIVRSSTNGKITDAIPAPFNARTRVHEYGGGAYCVHGHTIFFSNFKDQRLYRQEPNEQPQAITEQTAVAGSLRYADGRVTPDGNWIICVRERHEAGREAINEIISLPVNSTNGARVIVEGYDFYSFPRISPDGRYLAWTCWRHPQMPWDGTELWVGELTNNGSIANTRHVAGSASESIFQPEWSPDGTLYFVSDRTGWCNLYAERREKVVPVLEIDAEIGVPQWLFGYSRYAFLSNRRAACVYDKNGMEHLAIIDLHSNQREILPVPYTVFGSITSDGDDTLFVAAASPTKAAEVAALEVRGGKVRVLKRSLNVEIDPDYFSQPP